MYSFLLSPNIYKQMHTNTVIQPLTYTHPGSGPSFRRLNTCRGFSRYWNFQSTLCNRKRKVHGGGGILHTLHFRYPPQVRPLHIYRIPNLYQSSFPISEDPIYLFSPFPLLPATLRIDKDQKWVGVRNRVNLDLGKKQG